MGERWLNYEGAVAHLCRPGAHLWRQWFNMGISGSIMEAKFLSDGGEVAQLWKRGGSIMKVRWRSGSALDSNTAIPVRIRPFSYLSKLSQCPK